MSELEKICNVARESALKAGKLILRTIGAENTKRMTAKSSNWGFTTDLVTEVDKQCEDVILEYIRAHYPNHTIIAEESASEGDKNDLPVEEYVKPDSGYVWFVDPIDGSANFYHGMHYVAVSVGVRYQGVPVAGVIHFPVIGETYTAVKGKGAFCNGVRIRTSKGRHDTLDKACLVTEYTYDRTSKGISDTLERLNKVLGAKVQSIRTTGSCCTDMCLIASGRADIYFEGRSEKWGIKPWDVTAGEVIVREAGGIVVEPHSSAYDDPFDFFSGRILCCNGKALAKQFQSLNVYDPIPRVNVPRSRL